MTAFRSNMARKVKFELPREIGMPDAWRPIIEEEMNRAQMSFRDVMSKYRSKRHGSVRRAIWKRISDERGASAPAIARAFGYDHTSVLYQIGTLKMKPRERKKG